MSRDFSASNYMTVPDSTVWDDSDDLTVLIWIRPDSLSDTDTFFSRWDEGVTRSWSVTSSSSKIRFDTSSDGSFQGGNLIIGSTAITMSAWNSIICTHDPANTRNRVYLNGTLDGTTTSVAAALFDTSLSLWIGHSPSFAGAARYCDGLIAEVAVWGVVLSDSEIAALHAGTATPLTTQPSFLKGYWPVTGDDSPELDQSGNSNDAVITGTLPKGSSGPHDVLDTLSTSQTSSQSLDEQPDFIGTSSTSSQSIVEVLDSVLTDTQTSTQSLVEVVGYLETISMSATSSQLIDQGRLEIPLVDIVIGGVDPGGYVYSDASGHELENLDQRTFIEILSVDSLTKTVTFLTPYTQDDLALEDRVVSIAAGATKYVGPFPHHIYNQYRTKVYIDPTGSLKLRAFRLI